MGTTLGHKLRIKEHLDEINDAIDLGYESKPITIGFHCSACAAELLEFYLHKLNKISTGKTVKHNWFKRPKPDQKIKPLIERKLLVSFPDKERIYELIYNIEENRDTLVYGKATPEQIKKVLGSFMQLKDVLVNKIEEEGENIET